MSFPINVALRAAVVAAGLLAAPAAYANCPDWQQNGTLLDYSSDALFAPKRHDVIAGGTVDLLGCPTAPGGGWITAAPDFTMQFSANTQGRALEFRVEAGCDTVLLVNDAAADWHFNDDDSGVNPRLRLEAAPDGIYDVWVGSFDSAGCAAVLVIETF